MRKKGGIFVKKLNLFFVVILFLSLISACGGTDHDGKNDEKNDTNNQNEQENNANNDDDNNGFSKEFNQSIVDNENVRATLVKVERVRDEFFDEDKVLLTFEVENKQDFTIEVQAREVSADNKMVDESMLTMSQEVAAGKLADAVLTIQ